MVPPQCRHRATTGIPVRRMYHVAKRLAKSGTRVQFPPPPLFLNMRLEPTHRDKSRLKTLSAKEVATRDDEGESRQQAAASDMPRPVAATKSATDGSEADRDLAVVVAAWPNLADSVRAAVMRIIQASSSTT